MNGWHGFVSFSCCHSLSCFSFNFQLSIFQPMSFLHPGLPGLLDDKPEPQLSITGVVQCHCLECLFFKSLHLDSAALLFSAQALKVSS